MHDVLGPMENHFTHCTTRDYFLTFFVDENTLFKTNFTERATSTCCNSIRVIFVSRNKFSYGLPSWKNVWNTDSDLSVLFVSSALSKKIFAQSTQKTTRQTTSVET